MEKLKSYKLIAALWTLCLVVSAASAHSSDYESVYLTYSLFVVIATNVIISIADIFNENRNGK